MLIISTITPFLPLMIIIVSTIFSYLIVVEKIRIKWNTRVNIIYWLMPVISFFFLSLYVFLYAYSSKELGNGAIGLLIILPMSVLFPFISYLGLLYLEYNKEKQKQRIIWITPSITVFLYLILFVLIILLDSKDKDRGDIIYLFKFFCTLLYFNSINVFPLVAIMIAKVLTFKHIK